jgi:hypothetical protein
MWETGRRKIESIAMVTIMRALQRLSVIRRGFSCPLYFIE